MGEAIIPQTHISVVMLLRKGSCWRGNGKLGHTECRTHLKNMRFSR